MMTSLYILIAAIVATIITRFLPFVLLNGKHSEHPIIVYLGEVLPYASIGLLVVYALSGTKIFMYPYGIPEVITLIFIYLIHKKLDNSLISIVGGTVVYMLLVQFVFI